MGVVALLCRSALGAMLVIAGAAKLSDLSGFSATVRLFVPRGVAGGAGPRALALAVAAAELAVGAASLSFPAQRWLNVAVLVLALAFVAVAAYGYRFHRGRTCTCFGALSGKRFDRGALLRSAGIAAGALLAMWHVTTSAVASSAVDHLLLLGGCAVLALVSYTASKALAISLAARPELAGR